VQRNKGDAYHINANGAKHHGEAILVQPTAYHAKAVARGGGQGPAAPRGGCSPLGASLPLLAVVVAWKHAKAVEAGYAPRIASEHRLPPV
jgi:hypothetical protein